jgi:hypothetical protein
MTKFTKTLFAILVLAIANPSAGAEKYMYRSSGLSAYAYEYGWGPCGYNFFSVNAFEATSKIKDDGKPTTPLPYMDFNFNLWTDSCDTYFVFDWDTWYSNDQPPPTVDFPSKNKLETGSATNIFPGLAYPCFGYYDCDWSSPRSVEVEIAVAWTGEGATFKDRNTQRTNYEEGGFSQNSFKGVSRDASFTVTGYVDGSSFSLPDADYSYGSLSKSSSSEIAIYKNNN